MGGGGTLHIHGHVIQTPAHSKLLISMALEGGHVPLVPLPCFRHLCVCVCVHVSTLVGMCCVCLSNQISIGFLHALGRKLYKCLQLSTFKFASPDLLLIVIYMQVDEQGVTGTNHNLITIIPQSHEKGPMGGASYLQEIEARLGDGRTIHCGPSITRLWYLDLCRARHRGRGRGEGGGGRGEPHGQIQENGHGKGRGGYQTTAQCTGYDVIQVT